MSNLYYIMGIYFSGYCSGCYDVIHSKGALQFHKKTGLKRKAENNEDEISFKKSAIAMTNVTQTKKDTSNLLIDVKSDSVDRPAGHVDLTDIPSSSHKQSSEKQATTTDLCKEATSASEWSLFRKAALKREEEIFKKIQNKFPDEFVSRDGHAYCRKCNVQVSIKSKNAMSNIVRHIQSQSHVSSKGLPKSISAFFKAKTGDVTST